MADKAKGVMILTVLTFVIPAVQWLAGKFGAVSSCTGFISSMLVILFASLWFRGMSSFHLFPPSRAWKILCYLGMLTALILLVINIGNEPVSRISGQARSPLETVDVIVSLPLAEELVFRGITWWLLAKLTGSGNRNTFVVLAGSSILFGAEHLGYWAQSSWPLPFEAFLHALSMVAAGICFGMFRQTSQSLAVPMVVHMLANDIILLMQ